MDDSFQTSLSRTVGRAAGGATAGSVRSDSSYSI